MTLKPLGTLLGALLIQMAIGATGAVADGLPVLGLEGTPPGLLRIGEIRYVTRPAGRDTRVLRLARTGRVIGETRLRGRFVIPVVAYDGSAAGLSSDGRTLVVIRPRMSFPQATTTLAIVGTRAFHADAYLKLRGDFSFDAISPDGRWIYVIQYISRLDPTQYRVRVLNADTRRLARRDIVDPHDRGDEMRGSPITRATSLDGRWAYTLYNGMGHPFVHALDTASRQARCIDLPVFPATADWFTARLRFSPDNTRLLVTINHRTVAEINRRTLTVSDTTRGPARIRVSSAPAHNRSAGAIIPIAVVLAVTAAGMALVRRRSRGPSRPGGARRA
jgi:hypothetical protein